MAKIANYLTLRQELEYNADQTAGGATIKAPARPSFTRVDLDSSVRYKDQVMDAVDPTDGEQVFVTNVDLAGSWLYIENMGDGTDDTGVLGIYDASPTATGEQIGTINAGERWGPVKLGSHWTALWLMSETASRFINARVVLIET